MYGAMIGDIVGSRFEFLGMKNKDFQPLFAADNCLPFSAGFWYGNSLFPERCHTKASFSKTISPYFGPI